MAEPHDDDDDGLAAVAKKFPLSRVLCQRPQTQLPMLYCPSASGQTNLLIIVLGCRNAQHAVNTNSRLENITYNLRKEIQR